MIRGIFNIVWAIAKAGEIKQDPERRAKSVRFGVQSIISAICAVPLSLLMILASNLNEGAGVLLIVFWIALFAIGVLGALICLFEAIFRWILQITINRKAVTWIALAVWILALGACVYVAITALGGYL